MQLTSTASMKTIFPSSMPARHSTPPAKSSTRQATNDPPLENTDENSHTRRFPFRAASPSGLSVELNANGSIRRMDCGDIMLNLFLGNEAEGGPANIHLRRLGETVESIPLLGPGSPASYQIDERGMAARGTWGDLAFRLRLVLAESATAWFWHVELENTGADAGHLRSHPHPGHRARPLRRGAAQRISM